jgi:hypothetical protein
MAREGNPRTGRNGDRQHRDSLTAEQIVEMFDERLSPCGALCARIFKPH